VGCTGATGIAGAMQAHVKQTRIALDHLTEPRFYSGWMRRYIAVLAIVTSGCSFLFVSGPPANHTKVPYFECSSSNWAPIVDTVVAALQIANVVVAAKDTDQQWHDMYCAPTDTTCNAPFSRGAAIPAYIGFSALAAASLYYGYTRVAACKSAKDELATRAAVEPPAGTWPPAPAPAAPAPAALAPAAPEPTPAVAPTP
jgi:hypothetical protein